MTHNDEAMVLDPFRALSLELPRMEGIGRRWLLRTILTLSGGTVRIEGAERLATLQEPAIFALTHHNAWESVLGPAALVALRGGRRIRFLVDWMFVDLPWTGWLVRQIDPIPVYGKRALFRLRETHRRRRRLPAFDRALAALVDGDDVGLYPEGRRNGDPWRLAPLRSGLARLAVRSGAPVVPVGVDYPARDRLHRLPRAGRIILRIGEPIDATEAHEAFRASEEAAGRRVEREVAAPLSEKVQRELARLSRKVCVGVGGRPGKERMSRTDRIEVQVVRDSDARSQALSVIAEVYRDEKGWIADSETEISSSPGADASTLWLLARTGGQPVGVLRLGFDPPLELPQELQLELEPGVDLERLAASGRFVEIGRLMIRSRWRAKPGVVLALMRAALAEVLERGYSHLVTAVFEDDPHSPYGFHTRQLGFERIGTHGRGELNSSSRRILLVLDIGKAYRRLTSRRAAVVGHLARGLEARLSGAGSGTLAGALESREAEGVGLSLASS